VQFGTQGTRWQEVRTLLPSAPRASARSSLLNKKEKQNKMTNNELYNELKEIKNQTYICKSCMNGHHESIDRSCECICHCNPECFVCGKPLMNEHDIIEQCHVECQVAYDIQESERVSESPMNRYPWEQ
jgi:hypothetical protein